MMDIQRECRIVSTTLLAQERQKITKAYSRCMSSYDSTCIACMKRMPLNQLDPGFSLKSRTMKYFWVFQHSPLGDYRYIFLDKML